MAINFKRYHNGKDCIGFVAADPCYDPSVWCAFYDTNADVSGWTLDIGTTPEGDLFVVCAASDAIADDIEIEVDGNGGIGFSHSRRYSEGKGGELGMDSAAMFIGTESYEGMEINTMSDGQFGNIITLTEAGETVAYIVFGWFEAECDDEEKIRSIISYNFDATAA